MSEFYSCTQESNGITPCEFYETWYKKPLEIAIRLKIWQEKYVPHVDNTLFIFGQLKIIAETKNLGLMI